MATALIDAPIDFLPYQFLSGPACNENEPAKQAPVAAALNVSARTLLRHLQAEGTCY